MAVTFFLSVVLFWFIETAIERQIFGLFSLFSFFAEGTPTPGKIAVFLACLLLCCSIGLTASGKRLLEKWNFACKKNGIIWLISFLVVSLLFLWTLRITVISFMTNDDTFLLKTIASVAKNGLSAASGSFANALFCGLISLFYRINGEGYWYAGYHLVALVSSYIIIGRCILLKIHRRNLPILTGCLIIILLYIGLFLYTLAQLSFTVTPAVVGTAAVALVLCRSDTQSRTGRITLDMLSVILMLLCYLHRPDSGKALLCFWALAVVYQAVKILLTRHPQWKKHLLGLSLCVLSVLVLIVASHAANRSDTTYDADYWNAEYYRSMVMDYILPELTPEELAAVGIPYELSHLLRTWFFMDERINTDTFRTITDLYYKAPFTEESQSFFQTLSSHLISLNNAFWSSQPQSSITFLAIVLLLLCLVAFIFDGRKYWLEFLCTLCAMGGALLLCLYLVIEGRFLFRVYLVVLIPAIVTILLMALSSPDTTSEQPAKHIPMRTGISVLLLAAACVFCGTSAYNVPGAADAVTRGDYFYTQWQTEAYANQHSDIYFVTNFHSQNLDPFHGSVYPSNMGLWGGTGVTASSNRLYADDFFREDIRFMCELPGRIMLVLQYLTLDHGPVQALDVIHLTDNIYVFDLSQVSPGKDYTGWYDRNGFTYYFENGQAVTGTMIIDGVEYQFAPSGASAPMLRLETEEGIIYTTNAYALIKNES